MLRPTFADYVQRIYTLFEEFERQQTAASHRGHPFTYAQKLLIVFFVIMHFRCIFRFKTQRRWLENHPKMAEEIGFKSTPHRTTLSRRYKKLYEVVQAFIAFLGQWAEELDEAFNSRTLYEDKSLFKAQGPVWHQKDRKAGRIPKGLRNLDTDASWSKSGYHGWVYGYGLHVTCNRQGFPKLAQVETGSVSESQVIDQKASQIQRLEPHELVGDDNYTKYTRIRTWAKAGVALLVPALKWVKGRYAQAYHRFIGQPENAHLLSSRKTAVEPLFDLISKVVGTTDNHKQLLIKGLANVQTCLTLGVLTVQIAMIANSMWGLPYARHLSHGCCLHLIFMHTPQLYHRLPSLSRDIPTRAGPCQSPDRLTT
jgi:hypothetical protein